jgi:hypothetical protein
MAKSKKEAKPVNAHEKQKADRAAAAKKRQAIQDKRRKAFEKS